MVIEAAALLRLARQQAGLSQRGLARLAGATQPEVARIESGRSQPTFETLLRFIHAAGLELDAKVYTDTLPEGLAFDCSARTLARAAMWNLVTSAGRIDIAFVPAGTDGYADLASRAIRFEVFGATVAVARLEDILRSKEAA